MNILQLCHKPPLPAIDGGCIAMNNITKGLIDFGAEVKVLTIETAKHPMQWDVLPIEYIESTHIESVFVDTNVNIIDAFSALITSDSYNISRFFSPDFDIKLIEILNKEKFDIIHLESLFMTPYIATVRRYSKGKIILRSHNLEYIIWERLADASKNQAKKAYLKLLSRQLKKYELNVINQVDGIAAISNEDLKKYLSFKCTKPIVNIPFGIDLENYRADNSGVKYPSLFHIGAMDWQPNLEGIVWFLKNCWPLIHKNFPDIKLYLAGRKMPKELFKKPLKNVIVDGEVPNAIEYMKDKAIMIVPLLSAGGIRVKIIEAMAMAKTVVSTKTGAEGIDYRNKEHLLIANKVSEFFEVIKKLIEDKTYYDATAKEARKLTETHYDNKLITRDLVNFYNLLLS